MEEAFIMSDPIGTLTDDGGAQSMWSSLSYKEKNWLLFLRQKTILDTFLAHGAISRDQHDRSLRDLIEKMGIAGELALYS